MATLLVLHVLETTGEVYYAVSVLLALYNEEREGEGGRAGGIRNWKLYQHGMNDMKVVLRKLLETVNTRSQYCMFC